MPGECYCTRISSRCGNSGATECSTTGTYDVCVCNRKVIYYYYITLPSITITITITSKKFQSITITITGKSVYYILQLHITYYYYNIPDTSKNWYV